MANQEFIIDTGLFTGENEPNISQPDSFETITNLMKTIKEYRDYTQPDSANWEEYVLEFFHILGFNTEKKAPRMLALRDMGTSGTPQAIVGVIRGGENFEEIVPGLDWLSHLFFVCHYYKVDWGILTNGLQLKIINVKQNDYQQTLFWTNLDRIVENERLDSFFKIYKIFSYIRGQKREGEVFNIADKKETVKRQYSTKRAGTGHFPMKSYRIPILSALIQLNGSRKSREVLELVFNIVESQLTELDLGRLASNNELFWRNRANWERLVMVEDGLLSSNSSRGIWEITPEGRHYYDKHKNDANIR